MKTINLVVLIFLIFNTTGSYSQEIKSIDIEQQLDLYRKNNEGYSHISTKSEKMWDRSCGNIVDKEKKWLNNAYGLIVHSTGRSIITAGLTKKQKKDPIILYNPKRIINRGKMIFNQNKAINYILGWGGIKSDHLIQIGNENEKCFTKRKCKCYSGVSMSEQRNHIKKYGFGKELKQSVYSMWRERWKGYKTPLNLIPKGGINNSFIQIECIPLPPKNKRNSLYKPLREGLWFTKEQHDAVALLACDIAIRNGWDLDTEWWKSNKLLGHEDLSPVTRSSNTQLYIDDLTLFTKATKKGNKYIINKKRWGSKVPKNLANSRFNFFEEELSKNTDFVKILTGKFKRNKMKVYVYRKKTESWDPGFLRNKPRFDWNYVYNRIKEIRDENYKELISLF